MVCVEGGGRLSNVSLRNQPALSNEPPLFAALWIRGQGAQVLEAPLPAHKFDESYSKKALPGLPRFDGASFEAKFPFCRIELEDAGLPLAASITAWSPFEPGRSDDSSLPVATLEYRFVNRSGVPVEAVFSFNGTNFLGATRMFREGDAILDGVRRIPRGFVFESGPADDPDPQGGAFAAWTDDAATLVDASWFRGSEWAQDALAVAWKNVADGFCLAREAPETGPSSPGASLSVPFRLAPGEEKTVSLRFAWYFPRSRLRTPLWKIEKGRFVVPDYSSCGPNDYYAPWYAGRFASVDEVVGYWDANYDRLRIASKRFSDCLFASTIPEEALDAVAANLSVLKSPTVLRQIDGKLWAWEGSWTDTGSCDGSCTHVWNYNQAIAHLFPDLERSLRETEFGPSQDAAGHQFFRSRLPIRPADKASDHDNEPAAADGQLGGIMKVYRDWRICGDDVWLRDLWPAVRRSLDYCIEHWDPRHTGCLEEPQHNTYDIEFWGPNGFCSSFYLGALKAAVAIGEFLHDDVEPYRALLGRGQRRMSEELFDGEYYVHRVSTEGLRQTPLAVEGLARPISEEDRALCAREGPKYQYGIGCLSDGVLGAWHADLYGIDDVLPEDEVASHLAAVYRHNFKRSLKHHVAIIGGTTSSAIGSEGGLLTCTWPKGGQPTLAFPYGGAVWTGIEYQAASHMILHGMVAEGLDIVRTARGRQEGIRRNPFDEVEAGHWYGRALSSYALLQALGGARYDAVDRTLYLRPALEGDYSCFLATASGYGQAGVRDGMPFLVVWSGDIDCRRIDYLPAA